MIERGAGEMMIAAEVRSDDTPMGSADSLR